ncbi:MAG: PKD domain-containing protein [Candidatus Aminicenantes bacterium]|nr:PKD domain-containing protein [Candidatus Aminicenantes bacterium]
MKILKRIIILSVSLLLVFSLIGDNNQNLSIEQMREVIKAKGLPFTVAPNDVINVPLKYLCGLVEPPNWRDKGKFDGGIQKGAKLPTSFDWRDTSGIVNPIKNQGSCGSCWAFGTLGSYEGTVAVAGGGLSNLSEEWMLDCNSLGYDCGGGWWAFSELYDGAPLTSCYPYVGSAGSCNTSCTKYHPMDAWYYVGSSSSVPSTDDIKNAMYNYGPIAAAVHVDSYFQGYDSGIFTNTSSAQCNHAIVLVGWDDSGGYWILRNSWATSWGESGYMRIAYGANSVGYAAAYGIPENIAPQPPVANFSGSPTTVVVGNSVSFSDLSTNNPTSWSWTFEGGTPSSSTAQNPTVTYNTIGAYNVSLTATNAAGSDGETKIDYITVQEVIIEYCTSSGTNQNYEYIAGVQVANLNNGSGASPYSNFTSYTANLTAGASASVSLTPGFVGSSYTEYWKIWIDYNCDGDFSDSGEEVFAGSGSSTVSGSFNVPSGLNCVTRMRVSMSYSTYPPICGTFTYGEVEDYTVDISAGTVYPPVANFTANDTTVEEGDSVSFTDQSTNNPTSWSWTFEGGTPSGSTAQNPSVTYNTAGTYDVSLTATNSAGSDGETKTNYITVSAAPTTGTVGNTTIFGSTSTSAYRRAMPFTMPENGTITSVTMYHTAGSGSMILAVYEGSSTPTNRLAITPTTTISGSTGWQTINLSSSVYVSSGTTVWLAWVYQTNPGIRYQTGSPGRYQSTSTWSGGMPDPFGSGSQSNYLYSIYATYNK